MAGAEAMADSVLRHAELVSASIVPIEPSVQGEEWTLKQVQGDEK
jgi:hypothetical protein